MPYATLRQAKSCKRQRRSRVRQEWLVSISTGIICVGLHISHQVAHFYPPVHLIDKGYATDRHTEWKQEEGLKEAEEGSDRVRKNE